MQRFGGAVLLAVMAACSSGSGGGGSSPATQQSVALMSGFNPGPAPDPSQGFQIILPIVTDIQPGGSYEYCTDTSMILQQDAWVDATQGYQSETGHHVIFFYTMNPVAPGTHLCAADEMGEFQFGLPAGGGPNSTKFTAPGNLAVHLPAGAQIIVNHHYLNASATPVAEAQSALNVYYTDPTVPHTPSSMMVILNSSMTVPTGASTYTEDCTINQTYEAWMQVPHMHAWGTHITITDTPASGAAPAQLFNMDWQADYAFDLNSVATSEAPTAPFVFNKGDKIHIECDYLNTTGAEITFGTEMCVMANFTVDPNNIGSMSCDGGQWGSF
jgi:hypothetical protein